MVTSFIRAALDLFAREPIRVLYVAGIAAQALYGQLSGGASLENAAIAVAILVVGEIQRSQVSPAG
jgi:hypothetical protein